MSTSRERLLSYYSLCAEASSRNLKFFLNETVINSHPEPKKFGTVAEPWQREIIDPKVAALEGLCGMREYRGPRSFLTVLGRGHDKSSLEGRLIAGALCFSRRKIEGYLCAADRDQAALILKAMKDEAELNPWWGKKLEFTNNGVTGPSGSVEVVPADAGSAYGFRGNLYVMDEVTHWKNDKLWSAVVSGRQKIPGSLLICITNAGVLGSWQHELLWNTANRDPEEWKVFYRRGHLASWVTAEALAKTRALLPGITAKRVLDNEWVDPAEETGYLSAEEVDRCIEDSVVPVPTGAQVIGAVDYGATNDRTAKAELWMDSEGIVRISDLSVAQGSQGRPVKIATVESWIEEMLPRCRRIFVDPHQMEGTLQRFPTLERVQFRGGAFNCDIATNLRTLILSRRLRWSRNTGMNLAGELKGLVTKITPHGYRFDHASGKHDDQAFAVAVAALEAVKRPFVGTVRPGDLKAVYSEFQVPVDGMKLFG